MSDKMKRVCQATMGEFGNYFECGKPAKYLYKRKEGLRPKLYLCGIHARAIAQRWPDNVQPLTKKSAPPNETQ